MFNYILCLFGLVDLTLVEIGEFIHRYIENYLYIRYVLVYGKHAAVDCFNFSYTVCTPLMPREFVWLLVNPLTICSP